jgi:hypothetical protein
MEKSKSRFKHPIKLVTVFPADEVILKNKEKEKKEDKSGENNNSSGEAWGSARVESSSEARRTAKLESSSEARRTAKLESSIAFIGKITEYALTKNPKSWISNSLRCSQ